MTFGGGIGWTQVRVRAGTHVTDERTATQKDKPVGGAVLRGVIYDMANGKTIGGVHIEAQKRADTVQAQSVLSW